ncbi:hypothetical protein BC835DRAFT_1312469 [Cytidiella melzeri]|nr:hypothetical protein BC835DRAFT_1312469 [Cytidiella melzeri]
MPIRPPNLSASSRPDNADYNIVPRTPHSRSGRAEEGFTEDDLQDHDALSYATYRRQQTEPLLASSSSSSFPTTGYRSRGDDGDARKPTRSLPWLKSLTGKNILRNTPLLIGVVTAGILLSLAVVSFRQPNALDQAMGYTAHTDAADAPSAEHIAEAAPQPPQPSFVDTIPEPGHEISYENYTKFPLTGQQYRDECVKLMSVKMSHGAYWSVPPHGIKDVAHHDDVTDYHLPESMPTNVCSKTITYQLDGHVGLVADLALMAQAAAFARERNRTFFVDDTYWNRGKWTDHFQDVRARQPGPQPGCRAPPPSELVACPRLARHWVINSRTARFHFGHGFADAYENAYKHGIHRQKPIFDRAAESFKQTIRPNAHNAELIRSARMEIASILSLPTNPGPARHESSPEPKTAEDELHEHNPDPYIAVHIRRGDRKTGFFPHGREHLPLQDYVKATQDTWSRLYHENISDPEPTFPAPPISYVGSDSHAAAHEFASAFPSSTAVFSLDSSTNADLRALAPQGEYVQEEFNLLDEPDRIRLTRGMVVDLAMLSGLWAWPGEVVPGATVCTITSTVCKVSAVGLGWSRAMGLEDGDVDQTGEPIRRDKRWVEIDNGGSVLPEWTGFDASF